MTHTIAMQTSTSLLAQLANPAARALVLAGAAAIALAAFRVKATSLRLFTWTAVLYAAIAMPLLGRLLPPLSVPTPVFLEHGIAQSAPDQVRDSEPLVVATIPSTKSTKQISSSSRTSQLRPRTATSGVITRGESPSFLQSSVRSSIWSSIPWSMVATGIYLAVAILLLVRVVVGLVFGHRLMQASQTIHEPRLTLRFASRAYICGLAFIPRVAESEIISVPVTMGAFRSTILLPTDWREWDDAKLDAVVAHEVSHVARRDALTQRLSLLHRAIFWFSPLAWWLDRHLANLAEQASDEAALSGGADRNDYARTLLGFFEALQATPGRVWWQGVSMAKAGQAERRVERILAWREARGAVTMSLKKSLAVAIIALAIPVVYLTASVHAANQEPRLQDMEGLQDRTTTPVPRIAPAPRVASQDVAPRSPADAVAQPALAPTARDSMAPPPARAAVAGVVAKAGRLSVGPVAPVAPLAAMPPPAIWSDQSSGSGSSHSGGFAYQYGYDDEQRFVITSGKSDSYTMSGSTEDIRHVEKLKKQIAGDFIWFQRDEKSYIIRDQATIDRARKFWAPQEELGKKQEELGKQQEVLGKQQEALGERMEQIKVNVPDMTAALDRLKAKLQKLGSSATMDQIGDLQEEIGELQSKIGDIQSQAGEQQGKLGEEQGALGEKQGKLGEQQGKLGEEQGKLAEQASRQMKELLDEAIKKGTAQPEP